MVSFEAFEAFEASCRRSPGFVCAVLGLRYLDSTVNKGLESSS